MNLFLLFPLILTALQVDTNFNVWQSAQDHIAATYGIVFAVSTTVELQTEKTWSLASATRGEMQFTRDLKGRFSVIQSRHSKASEVDDFRLHGGCDGDQIWLADASSKVCQSMTANKSNLLHLLGGFRLLKKWLGIPEMLPVPTMERRLGQNGSYSLTFTTNWGQESYSFSAANALTSMTRTTSEGQIRTTLTLTLKSRHSKVDCKDWASSPPKEYTFIGEPKSS